MHTNNTTAALKPTFPCCYFLILKNMHMLQSALTLLQATSGGV